MPGDAMTVTYRPAREHNLAAPAVARGFRIVFPAILMSSKPFGDWSRYLPHNPGFV
jgi:hypothetical protein